MTALNDAIAAAQALDETDYTESTWADLETALYGAIAVKNDRFAGTTLITAAAAALTDATEDLVPVTCATPTASPAAGAVEATSEVELACATAGSIIYFTVDGSAPDDTKTEYTEPITISGAVTIKAKAYKGAMDASGVLTAAYTIAVVATPTATPPAGEVADDTQLVLACATAGATIHYTLDGSVPDDTDPEYTLPIVIADPVTVKAKAYKANMTASGVLSAAYTVV